MDIIEKFLNNNIAEQGIIRLIILKYLSSKNADAIIKHVTVKHNVILYGIDARSTVIKYNNYYREYVIILPESDRFYKSIDVFKYKNKEKYLGHICSNNFVTQIDYYMNFPKNMYNEKDKYIKYTI